MGHTYGNKMSNELVITEITSLERKLSVLVKEYQELKSTTANLEKENAELKSALSQKDQSIERFQNKAEISKIVSSVGADENEAADLKKKLDEYIKELDKCIAHLSYE